MIKLTGDINMSVYCLSNFDFEDIACNEELKCVRYIGLSAAKAIINNVQRYFSSLIEKELQREAKNLIEYGYSDKKIFVLEIPAAKQLKAYGTHIEIVQKHKLNVSVHIESNELLVLTILTYDDKYEYTDKIKFSIPSCEKILVQYQNREITSCLQRDDIIKYLETKIF